MPEFEVQLKRSVGRVLLEERVLESMLEIEKEDQRL